MNRFIASAIVLAGLLVPGLAHASSTVIQVRSAEDPAAPPDPAVCAAAPFHVNLRLGGSLYAYETRGDGSVVGEGHRIGRATACAAITNFAFPTGLVQNFYARFELPEGSFTAAGTCTLITNDMPARGLIVAGCNLKLVAFPADRFLGGTVTSTSTFNPFRLKGFTTGSYYTFQLFDSSAADSDHDDSDHALEWVDDGTSQEEQ
ncbi:MAG TPA: hypothetical protein VN874_05630 [Myxococcales bacterium]|jgi:hypothetical protein|nr:hypothetical protein [Myxococcales bacterium]